MKRDNRGLSLVELLVAIAISAVVAGSIGFLLVTSLRMYNNEITEVSLQQELQMTLNQVMDYAMESQTVCTGTLSSGSDYLVLGTIEEDYATSKTYLHSEIFWVEDTSLYMRKVKIDYDDDLYDHVEDAIAEVGSNPVSCLLADYVTSVSVVVRNVDDVAKKYKNPLSIDISLEFSKNASSGPMFKSVSDTATLRNRVNVPIYLNTTDKYEKHADSVLNITTETVNMEKNAGFIKTEGTAEAALKSDLHVLEIVPDYTYDYVQYVIGGRDGALLNSENTDYGDSAPFGPVTSDEMDGFIFRKTGQIDTGNDYYRWDKSTEHGWLMSNYFPNSGSTINATIFLGQEDRVGYYEYVGPEKGIYAVNAYTADEYPTPGDKGYGNARPKILSFTMLDNFADSKRFTRRCFNPVFERVMYDDDSGEYYKAEPDSGSADYNLEIVGDEQYFVYAGEGSGQYSVRFEKENRTGYSGFNGDNSEYSAKYKLREDKYTYYRQEGGKYYAYIDGWETRATSTQYSEGFDFNKYIQTVSMLSKYSSSEPGLGKDYVWVWREAKEGSDLYNSIVDGKTQSAAGIVETKSYTPAGETGGPSRIYLKNHSREKMINNETFKMSVMQDVMETYVNNTPQMLDINNGIWDKSRNTYDSVNYGALKAWEEAGHKVTLSVRTPGDLDITDIEKCDLIIFAEPESDGGFKFAHNATSAIKGLPMSGDGQTAASNTYYSLDNDISFKNAVAIYKRVIKDEIAIACPTLMINYGGGNGGKGNLSRLFIMLYCVVNEDISIEQMTNETYLDAKAAKIEKQGESKNYWTENTHYQEDVGKHYVKNWEGEVIASGSGRDFFSDYLLSMSDDCLSAPLYNSEPPTLKTRTTEIAYLDESDSNPGRVVFNSMSNRDVDGTTLNYSSFSNTEWGRNIDMTFMNINNNKYLCDRYIGRGNWYGGSKASFVSNSTYGHEYRFIFAQPSSSFVYKNMVCFNNESSLLTYKGGGGTGMVTLSIARGNSNQYEDRVTEKKIGTIEVVGAGIRTPGDNSQTYEDSGVRYQIRPERRVGGGDGIVFYLSENELLEARKNGLNIYCVVKTGEEITYDESDPYEGSRQQNNAIWYSRNEEFSTRYEDEAQVNTFDWLYSSNLTSEATQYAEGSGVNEKIVREYTYSMDHYYFDNFFDPNNDIFRDDVPARNVPNNRLKAIIKAESSDGTQYRGEAEFIFIVRDGFDLD